MTSNNPEGTTKTFIVEFNQIIRRTAIVVAKNKTDALMKVKTNTDDVDFINIGFVRHLFSTAKVYEEK